MNKITCALLFFVFALTIGISDSCKAANTQNVSAYDVAKAEAEAQKVSQEHKKIQQQANKIKSELAEVNKKMIAAAKKIQNGEDEVSRRKEELQSLQKKLAESEKKFATENSMLVETLAALENLALRPSEAILVQPLSPVEVMRSSLLLRGSAHALEKRASIIRAGIDDINEQKDMIASQLAELEEENKNLETQRAEMEKMSKQKSEMYGKLSTQSAEAKKRADALASQASGLRDLLEKLEKQKQEAKQLAEKRRLEREREIEKVRTANNHQLKDTGYDMNEYSADAEPVSVNFAKAKGKLSRPARGPIITTFHQELSKGVQSNGIDIKTAAKAQVIAPYDGTVIFSGPFKNFDNLIILDHGDGYTSLLSGMKENNTQVGQMLLAGEPVGTMPSSDTAKLHMEIRKNNHPLNPNEWIAK